MVQLDKSGRLVPLDCHTCATLRSAQWVVLSDAEVAYLNQTKKTSQYDVGDEVFRQDSPCEGIHCIAIGSLVLRKINAQGNSVLIDMVEAGSTVGYRSYYNHRHHAEQAETLEPSTICLVPSATVEHLLAHNSDLSAQFAGSLAEDLRDMQQSLLDSVVHPVRARVARLLQLLIQRFGEGNENGQILLRLPFGRQEMASLLGIQRETVTRTLNALQSDGVLNHTGRTVVVEDLDRLLDELEST